MATFLERLCDHSHVCVGGCGTRSIFYFGFFEYMQQQPLWEKFFGQLKGAAGSSSGAITALALLVGGDFAALIDAMVTLSRQHSSIVQTLNVQQMLESYGVDDGEMLQLVVHTCMAAIGLAPSTTFASLKRLTGKDYRVCAVNMHTMTPTFFSAETSPHMLVWDAIYMSMTLPFIFKCRRYKGELHADGGLLANVPIQAFPDETPAAIYLSSHRRPEISSFREYAMSVLMSTLYTQEVLLADRRERQPYDDFRLLDDGVEQDAVSLDADEPMILAMQRRGYRKGVMEEKGKALAHTIGVLLTLDLAQRQPSKIADSKEDGIKTVAQP